MTAPEQSPRPFMDIPPITVPVDYPENMPEYLATMAEQHGPIMRRNIGTQGGSDQWIVYMVGPEANKFIMHTHRQHFSHDRGWTPMLGNLFEKGLLNTDDPEHARQRKMMNPAFAIAYMSRYLPLMQQVIATRTSDWAERGTVDVYQEMRKITFDIAAEALVGFARGPDVDRLRDLFYRLTIPDVSLSGSEADYLASFTDAQSQLNGTLLQMIADRRQHPTDDILGLLIQARDENGATFTDMQLLGQVHILLVAGHETSTSLASWLLYLLATHPNYLLRVQHEVAVTMQGQTTLTLEMLKAMPQLSNALDEAGRLYSPVGNVPRGVTHAVVFQGYTLPANTFVMLSLAACHRLPTIFHTPTAFDPDRFAPPREEDKRVPYSLVPFGGGQRICIGINFAQVEMKALVTHVVQRFTLAPDSNHIPQQVYYSPTASLPTGVTLHVGKR